MHPSTKHDNGSACFCIPDVAIDTLIELDATALHIGAYLVVASGTEGTGRYSTWSAGAVARRLQIGAARAKMLLDDLCDMRMPGLSESDEPLLMRRDTWLAAHPGRTLPDGPSRKRRVNYILHDFDEALSAQVWFGSGLVNGFGNFTHPLAALKDAGDVAARLLLRLYSLHDMLRFGGISPSSGAYRSYAHSSRLALKGGYVMQVSPQAVQLGPASKEICGATTTPLRALLSTGLLYEEITVLNRAAIKHKAPDGGTIYEPPPDAEPMYELACRSMHGPAPEGERGLGALTATVSCNLGWPVMDTSGQFDGTYAAIVPDGLSTMVAGIFRPRFRVANGRNAGVGDAWLRIQQGNDRYREIIKQIASGNM